MDLTHPDFISGLLAIILLDLVLAGDNAIVIAMAASRLPKQLQLKAVFWGTFGAIAVRFGLTAIVVYLLKLPGLLLIGGLVLLPIAWNLLRQRSDDPEIRVAHTFWQALRTIIIADALMGLDNVLAIAGASKGHLGLVIIGLLITVPLIVWGSTLIMKLIERFRIIIYIGAAAIAWTSARMISSDHLFDAWFDSHDWAKWTLDAVLVVGICALGWWSGQRQSAKRS
ncbi:MAG TPA: TerC family protein [Rhodanobacter sp.]|jgi:YjbE family integral membrane protein|nr:TerC family protein [Rhodanobacter sp.]